MNQKMKVACPKFVSALIFATRLNAIVNATCSESDGCPVPQDTYKKCEFPKFDWTVASISKYNSLQDHQYAIMDDTLYIGGTIVPSDPRDFGSEALQFVMNGPFNASNPTVENGVFVGDTITDDDGVLPNMCSFSMVDKNTGKPKDMLTINGTGSCHINSIQTNAGINWSNENILVAGGHHSAGGVLNVETSGTCTAVSNTFGAAYTSCESDQTTVKAHNLADTAFVLLMEPNGETRWLIQPWLTLIDSNSRTLDQVIYETSVTGVSVDGNGDVYIVGYRIELGETPIYHAMLSKHSGIDGGIYWVQEFPNVRKVRHLVYDESEDALFLTFEIIRSTQKNDNLNISCDPPLLDVQGCSVLARLSASNGSSDWTRYAYGFSGDKTYDGEVKLADPNDGPYVYATYSGVGTDGPSSLDLGTSYSGCKSNNGDVTAEIDSIFDAYTVSLNPTICTARQLGVYFSRSSDDAIPANLINSHAQCGAYNNYSHCLVKYHKLTGLPIWGSVTPQAQDFQPVANGIIMTGSNSGPAKFDTVEVSGPEGLVTGHSMVYQSKIGLNGEGLYVHPIIANQSSASHAGLTQDSETGDVYLGFSTEASKTYLGSGSPVGFIQDLAFENACVGKDLSCNSIQHVTIAKLTEEVKPGCIESCGNNEFNIMEGKCFIEQVCYDNKDTGARVGVPCMTCDSSVSKTKWTPNNCPSETSAHAPTANETLSPSDDMIDKINIEYSNDVVIDDDTDKDSSIGDKNTGLTVAGLVIGCAFGLAIVLITVQSYSTRKKKYRAAQILEFFPVEGEII